MSSNADALALPQTILSGLGLLAILVAIIALGVERIRRVREYDKGHDATKPALLGCFSSKPVSGLESLMGRHAPTLTLPSIGGLIEAADRRLWTSTTLDHMPEIHPELTWVPFYECVFDDLLKESSQLPECWKNNPSTSRVFKRLETPAHRHHRSNLSDSRRYLLRQRDLVTCVRSLEGCKPESRVSSKYQETGLARTKATWLVGKKPCIPVTREEFVALSLVMGMPITKGNDGHYSGIGAYGLSTDLSHGDAIWKLSLVKGSRIPRHAPSMGSGYTSLMAKHLACGSIPFSESDDWIRSVYVTDKVLAAVKDGLCITDTQAYGGPSLEFLRRLPAEKAVDAYYSFLEDNKGCASGTILDANNQPVGSWASLVAGIAFGGLVPQADKNVIEAVRFTVAGNMDRCVQNLEYLVDALHRDAPKGKNVFGQRVTERTEQTGHLYVNYDYPSSDNNPRDAASTFARYMNLLEHVVARSEGPSIPNDAPPSGRPVSKNADPEIELELLIENSEASPSPNQASDHVFKRTIQLLHDTYLAAVKQEKLQAQSKSPLDSTLDTSAILSDTERMLVEENLGDSLERIRNSLGAGEKIPLQSAAMVVRCILAAWAATVPQINVMEHVPASANPPSYANGAGVIFMDDLPPVMALC